MSNRIFCALCGVDMAHHQDCYALKRPVFTAEQERYIAARYAEAEQQEKREK